MTRLPDPPGEDHATSAALLRQETAEQRANDMVLDARQRCATATLALRFLANEYDDCEERTLAFGMLLEDVQMERSAAA